MPDAFTNPAHVKFALKVTFAAMFCYIVYEAIDWSGIHTAFITCTFIALESTEATLYKGTLRIVRLCDRRSARAFHHRLPHAAHGNNCVARRRRCLCLSHRRLGRRREANGSVMPGCKSRSLSFTASFKVTRPIPISITFAIALLASFLVSSSPGSCSDTSGRNEPNSHLLHPLSSLIVHKPPEGDVQL